MRKRRPEQGAVPTESVGFKTQNLTLMEVGCSLNSNPELVGVRSVLTHGTHGVPTGERVATRQPPSPPSFKITNTCGDDSVSRQRALVSDSLND